jgi:hypothetical protein
LFDKFEFVRIPLHGHGSIPCWHGLGFSKECISLSWIKPILAFHLIYLKPHCIQFSPVLVPAVTCRSRRQHFCPGIPVIMAYVANAVTLWRWLQQCVLAALRALTSSTLNWLNRIQSGFNYLRTDGDFCHQGWDTDIAKNIFRLSKPTHMTIHWKALGEHFLMVPFVLKELSWSWHSTWFI